MIGCQHLHYNYIMKKIHLLVLFSVLCTGSLWAQLTDSVLVDYYGAIRADMVRTVCQIVGYQDDSVLQKISNQSLTEFNNCIKQQDTLSVILKYAKTLGGDKVDVYCNNLRDTRRDFNYQLGGFFPSREKEIGEAFNGYIQIIDDLTKECNTFNSDTTPNHEMYLKAYPMGRFSNMCSQYEINEDKGGLLGQKSNIISHKSNKNKKKMVSGFFMGILLIPLIILGCFIGLLVVIIILIKKKRKMTHKCPPQKGINDEVETSSDMGKHNQEVQMEDSKSNLEEPHNVNTFPAGTPNAQDKNLDGGKEKAVTTMEGTTDVSPSSPKPQGIDPKGKSTAMDAGDWIVVGASVQGNGHVDMNIPCQDNHIYEYINNGWGIAITSDGAGSAKLSHIGAAATVARAMVHFKSLIEKEGWIEQNILPSDNDWMKQSYKVLKMVRNDLEALAQRTKCDIKDLSATIIVVIHSPNGMLVAHVGDGRAGYKDMAGVWHSMITPHKGEEANQTIFIPSDFWNIPFYEMSGATVPESRVIREKISAFTLMSDGCESTSWLWNQYNETTGKYYDPNLPHGKFFDSLLETLQSFREENVPLEERQTKWYQFIKDGNQSFVRETDDKTMILGALYRNK